MPPSATHFILPFLAASASTTLAFCLWSKRREAGAWTLIVLMLGAALWTLCSAFHRLVPDLAFQVWVARIQYLGITVVPVAMFVYALQYAGADKGVNAPTLGLLSVLPVAVVVLAWTNDWHGLVWAQITPGRLGGLRQAIYHHGPAFWVWMVYAYLLLLASTVLLVWRLFRQHNFYRVQIVVMLGGLAAPWAANGLYLSGLGPWGNLDLTPVGFNLTGLALAWGLFRFRLSDILPVARDSVFEGIPDAVLVLDQRGRLVDFNPAADRLLDLSAGIGRPVIEVLDDRPQLTGPLLNPEADLAEVTMDLKGQRHCFALHVSPLGDRRGRGRGRLIVLRDVSARKKIEAEREDLIAELQKALVEVKTLSGLLPICSSCKKIRDDQGYWQQIEVYLKEHSNADFTHGICPECKKKLYPGLQAKKE
jgi:PAS domain S-box-containing protein